MFVHQCDEDYQIIFGDGVCGSVDEVRLICARNSLGKLGIGVVASGGGMERRD